MWFDAVNLSNANLFHIFQVCPFLKKTLLKRYAISDNILKVHYLVKSSTFRLIKSNKNYHSYYLKILTVELHFSCFFFHMKF